MKISIFEEFSHPAANQVRENITVSIIPPRDAPVDLHLQVFVGLKSRYNRYSFEILISLFFSCSTLFHIFELARPLPMFSMYLMIDNSPDREPKGFVTFYLNERIPRVSQVFRFDSMDLSLLELDARMD